MGYSRQWFYESGGMIRTKGTRGCWIGSPILRGGVGTDVHAEEAHRAVRDNVSFARRRTERLPVPIIEPECRLRLRSAALEPRHR